MSGWYWMEDVLLLVVECLRHQAVADVDEDATEDEVEHEGSFQRGGGHYTTCKKGERPDSEKYTPRFKGGVSFD